MAENPHSPDGGNDAPNVTGFNPDPGQQAGAEPPIDTFDPIAELQKHGEGAKVVLDFVRETALMLRDNPGVRVRALACGVAVKFGPNSGDISSMAFLSGAEAHVAHALSELEMRALTVRMQNRGVLPNFHQAHAIRLDGQNMPDLLRALLAGRAAGNTGEPPKTDGATGEGPQG